jgi:hypothetical protein
VFTILQLQVIKKYKLVYFYNWQLGDKTQEEPHKKVRSFPLISKAVLSISYKEEGFIIQSSSSFVLTILTSGIVKA